MADEGLELRRERTEKKDGKGWRRKRRGDFSNRKRLCGGGLGRYVLIRISVSGAESRQLYVYIYLALCSFWCRRCSFAIHAAILPGLVQCGATAFQARRLRQGLVATPRCRGDLPPSSLEVRTTTALDQSRGRPPLHCWLVLAIQPPRFLELHGNRMAPH